MRGERAWGGGESGVHGEGPTQGWRGQGTCGAHVEHPAHARDLGRVEAERLVERRRVLPSQKARACDAGRGAPRALGCGGDAIGAHGEGPTQGWGGSAGAERTLSMSCMFVTLDVSKLSGWLNADADCRVEGQACDVGRRAAREARGRWVAAMQPACTGRDRPKCRPQRARAERTWNISYMVVTLEVSQLEMSALKFFKL